MDMSSGRRLLAGVAEPRRRAVGLPRRGAGRRVLLDCGAGRARQAPRARGLAAHRRDLHHALPPRPLGRPRPVGLGPLVRPGARACRGPSSGCRPAARSSLERDRRARSARPDMFAAGLPRARSTRRASRSRPAGFESRRAGSSTTTCSPSASGSRATGRRCAYSGDSGPSDAARRARARRRPLPLRGDAARAEPRGRHARPPRRRRGERGLRGLGREAAPAHAPAEGAPARRPSSSRPTTGSRRDLALSARASRTRLRRRRPRRQPRT